MYISSRGALTLSVTYKRIEYSPHAVSRMALRGIRREDVRRVLARGSVGLERSLPGRGPRFSSQAIVDGCKLEIVYTEDAHRIVVITVAWV